MMSATRGVSVSGHGLSLAHVRDEKPSLLKTSPGLLGSSFFFFSLSLSVGEGAWLGGIGSQAFGFFLGRAAVKLF